MNNDNHDTLLPLINQVIKEHLEYEEYNRYYENVSNNLNMMVEEISAKLERVPNSDSEKELYDENNMEYKNKIAPYLDNYEPLDDDEKGIMIPEKDIELPPISEEYDVIDVRQDKHKGNINIPPSHSKSSIMNVLCCVWLFINKGEIASQISLYKASISIISVTILAFVVAGISTIYQIESLPIVIAGLIQCLVIYLTYLVVYLLNGWINKSIIIPFTIIFVSSFIVIWICIYLVTRKKVNNINNKIFNNKNN